jgi:hypothetical protein
MDTKKSEHQTSEDSEYPTSQQMEECFTAWKKRGKQGLREYIEKQDQEAATKQ